MNHKIFIVPILLMLAFTGCRTTSNLNLSKLSITSEDVQKVIQEHHASIRTISGEGQVSVETPGFAQSGSFVLSLQKPDSILINIRGPFGIKVGSVLVTRNDFLFYNSIENKLITGASSVENLGRILHIKATFDDLVNLFAGGTFLKDDLHSPDETRIEDNRVVFVYTSNKSSRWYWIDPSTLLIEKFQLLDSGGKLTLEQTFSNFEDNDGKIIPYVIRVSQPKAQRIFTLSYSDVSINKGKLKFTFTIPQNAERIRW